MDLIKEQIQIAAGEPLSVSQEDIKISGMLSNAGSTRRIRRRTLCHVRA